MSETGHIVWCDLTVPDAENIKDFYSAVIGFEAQEEEMDGYEDYSLFPAGEDEDCTAGICHAKGANAKLPAQWLVYFSVADAAASAAKVEELGGKIIDGPRDMGETIFYCIQDPAGAVCALVQEKEDPNAAD